MGSERESAFSVTAGVAEDEEEPHLRENVEREGRFSTLVSDPEATASSASISPYLRSSSESLIKSGSSLDHMEIELDGIPRFRPPILQDHDIDQVKKRAAHVVYFPSLTYLALKLWLKKERRANTTSHVSRKAPDGEDRLRSSLSPNKPKGSSQATAVDFIGDPKLFVIKKELEFLLSELVKKIIAINKRFDESYENINRVNQEFNNSPQALKEIFETMRKEMRVDLTELEERASGRLVATPVPQTEEYNSKVSLSIAEVSDKVENLSMRILETASQCSEISQRLKLIENNIARAEKKQEILLVSRLNTSMLEIKDFLSEHLQSIGTRDAATSPTRKKARSIGKDTILQIHEKHEMYSQKSQYNADNEFSRNKNVYYLMSDESDDEYLSHPNSSEPPLPEKNQTGSGRYNLRNSGKRVKGYKEYTS